MSLDERIIGLCKNQRHKDINPKEPNFQQCFLWQRSCQTTRPTITDTILGPVDARNALYVHFRSVIEQGWTAVPSICNNNRCVNPFHAEIITEDDERCRGYLQAGKKVAETIASGAPLGTRKSLHKTIMNDIIFATYRLESRWNTKCSLQQFVDKAHRMAFGLRQKGVQKAKHKLSKAFRVYCLTLPDLAVE